jgi:hypothetical protein
MDDDSPIDPALERWSVPLDEPPDAPPSAPNPDLTAETPDVLQFPSDLEPMPTEGYFPRLRRFGDAA